MKSCTVYFIIFKLLIIDDIQPSTLLSNQSPMYFIIFKLLIIISRARNVRIRNLSVVLGYFIGHYVHCCPVENVREICPIKIDFE